MKLKFRSYNESEETDRYYAEVIIPLAVAGEFTYEVPEEIRGQLTSGMRVLVPFGPRHRYTGLVSEVHQRKPEQYKARKIAQLLDEEAIVSGIQLAFWKWLSAYYMSKIGEVMDAALPAYLKLKSETKIAIDPSFEPDSVSLADKEHLIVETLIQKKELSLKEITKLLDQKSAMPWIRSLQLKGVIVAREEVKDHYRPKLLKTIELHSDYLQEDYLSTAVELLEDKKQTQKQADLLLRFIGMGGQKKSIPKGKLMKDSGFSDSVLKSLLKKGILLEKEISVDRLIESSVEIEEYQLSPDQQRALEEIGSCFNNKQVCLLHGVTGSGKTLIYKELIEEQLKTDKQVLYLVPEIALTTQLISRLKRFFKDKIGLYHSKMSNSERVELWQKCATGEFKLIVGARSSIFLPFQALSMVVIDEEHDASYKQQDPSPRYNARDAAIYLALLHKAKVLMGSATPSLESMHNAQTGKYGYVTLEKRHGDMSMPEVKMIDLKKEFQESGGKNSLSYPLRVAMSEVLSKREQVILFKNRRGFAPVLTCHSCGFVPECINCDISLTYHKYLDKLSCHYCGYSQGQLNKCPSCGQHDLRMKGYGTEKLEEDVKINFDQARVARMDLDSTRGKYALSEIIHSMEEGELDILVGTQMVTKGLDFEKVRLVGILSIDSMLHYPDFRATERCYQLLHQVAGRAGRKGKRGLVLIQTFTPDMELFTELSHHEQRAFYEREFEQRRMFKYPPYYRLIAISVRHKDQKEVEKTAYFLGQLLRQALESNLILGPEYGSSPRLRNRYIQQLFVKSANEPNEMKRTKHHLLAAINHMKSLASYRKAEIIIDVDPY